MIVFPVVLDSCVLYPMYLRDTLLCCAEGGLYQVRWSQEILDGAFRNLIKDGRVKPEQAKKIQTLMNQSFREAMVKTTSRLIPCMNNDQRDRHVLATALVAKAEVIVTDNLRHFPVESLQEFNIEAQSADTFLTHLLDLSPEEMLEIFRNQVATKKKPRLSVSDLLNLLKRQTPNFIDKFTSLFPQTE